MNTEVAQQLVTIAQFLRRVQCHFMCLVLLLDFSYYLYVYVFFIHLGLYVCVCLHPQKPEKEVGSAGAAITDELPNMDAGR